MHDQHRHAAVAQHGVADAAEEKGAGIASSARADHDQVVVTGRRPVKDRLGRRGIHHDDLGVTSFGIALLASSAIACASTRTPATNSSTALCGSGATGRQGIRVLYATRTVSVAFCVRAISTAWLEA